MIIRSNFGWYISEGPIRIYISVIVSRLMFENRANYIIGKIKRLQYLKGNVRLLIICRHALYNFRHTDVQHGVLTLSFKAILGYKYTKPCIINRIWGLKQLWLNVNGHAWFHLQRLRLHVRNRKGAKNSKWKYLSQAGFEPISRQSTTGKSAH